MSLSLEASRDHDIVFVKFDPICLAIHVMRFCYKVLEDGTLEPNPEGFSMASHIEFYIIYLRSQDAIHNSSTTSDEHSYNAYPSWHRHMRNPRNYSRST